MLKYHTPFLPSCVSSYSEPFLGGGAMYIYVQETFHPKKCYINDINPSIVNIYRSIKTDSQTFCDVVDSYQEKYLPLSKDDRKKYYYEVRNAHAYSFHEWSQTYEAATLYFLMKTGFNGVWQINKNTNNRYGTPSGLLNQKDKIYCKETVKSWNAMLQNTDIYSSSYTDCPTADVNYLDPPYRSSTTAYGSDWSDQDLIELLESRKDSKDATLICNRDDGTNFFEKWKEDYNLHTFPVSYTVGRNGKTPATEILLVR